MSKQAETPPDDPGDAGGPPADRWRQRLRNQALGSALRKRDDGVPTYTVSEAAALLSISQEYLYRLIQAGSFPAVRMRLGSKHGRYVVPARAVEQLLNGAADAGACVEATDLPAQEASGAFGSA